MDIQTGPQRAKATNIWKSLKGLNSFDFKL